MRIWERFWRVLVCVIFLGEIAIAQVTTGTILGTVSDSTGAVIPGATVNLRSVETGISRTVTTDAAGKYRAPQLGLGSYEVSAEAAGFQTSVRTGITLTVGREASVDFTMQVGAVSERITVTGEAPLIETTNATVSTLVDERQIRELPLSGRSFTDLVAIQPGAFFVTTAGSGTRTGAQRRISVNGARPAQSLYLMDGIETMNVSANLAPSSVLGRQLGTEAVREFNVLTNSFGAQYGRAVGGVVNAVTRSGTNELHGSVYEFLRNEVLDANDFFVATNAPQVPLKQNQFGATFGGPIRKDSTFIFLAYEGERRREGSSDFSAMLDEDAREGVITKHTADQAVVNANLGFKLGDPLPTGLWKVSNAAYNAVKLNDYRPVNPWTAAVIRYTAVVGNGERLTTGSAGRRRYTGSRTRFGTENYGTARFDQKISDNDSLFGRFTADTSDASQVQIGNDPAWSGEEDGHYVIAAAQYTRILSPTTLNVFSAGFTRTKAFQTDIVPTNLDPILACVPGRYVCTSPSPSGVGVGGIRGGNLSFPYRLIGNTFTYQDQVTLNRGRHAMTTGAEYKRYRMNEFQNIWFNGQMTWSGGFANWFAGKPDHITGVVPQSENPYIPPFVYGGYRQTYVGLYFQDDFRVLSNLTVNLGLRWENMTDPADVNGRSGSVRDVLHDPGFTLGKVFEINADWKGLAPRFGFAWTPFASGKMAVRGGWGLFTEWPLTYQYILSRYISPFADRIQVRLPQMPFPFAGLRPGDPKFADTRDPIINDYDWHPAYTYQWNFGIEQQLSETFVATATYVGTRSLHLMGLMNPIAPVPQKDQNGRWYTPANAVPPNPNFGSIRYAAGYGDGWYNALQLGLERRFSGGLGFRTSFTFAKNLDTTGIGQQGADQAGGQAGNPNAYDLQADKSLSSLHNKKNFSASFNYELPFGSGRAFGSNLPSLLNQLVGGWQLNGVLSLRGGLPTNVMTAFLCSGNRIGSGANNRPDLRPGASNNPIIEGPRDFRNEEPYYDRTAFVAPPSCFVKASTDDPSKRGYFGNVGRSTLIGPGLIGMDASIFKNFRFGEAKSLQFRAEFFNVANHPNFGTPDGDVIRGARTSAAPDGAYSSAAGRITSLAGGNEMRRIQLALKFEF